jgi:hypothetical protein
MKYLVALFAGASLCACGPAGQTATTPVSLNPGDLGFLPAKPEKGALFQYYQPKARSKWRNNWTSPLDLTGVSWNDSRTATLIAPSYVVMAAHFTRPADVPVMFHDKNGKPYERFIAAVRPIPGADIAVAKLHLPLPPEIKPYRFARASEATLGRPVIITDQTNSLSVHRIERISGASIHFGYIPGLDSSYRRNLVVGDSGNPSFLLTSDGLALLGTHTTGGPGAGPFYGDPAVQAAIRAAMAEMGN